MAEKKQARRKSPDAKSEKIKTAQDAPNELNEPRWSVVSFERRAAKNLTYAEARAELEKLAAQKVAGLCIITDEAAERI